MNDAGGVDYDTATQHLNKDGAIETVKSKYGFAKFGRSQRERALFRANNVDKSLRKAVGNLSDVFTVSDKVRFNAKASKKPSNKVKWEATAVYFCRSSDHDSAADSENELRNEVFWSDDESDIQAPASGETQ
ncbi:hypothetical protein HPB48_017392 [Haemaphysalis longicornis]|uniref:Uncharacterized protein n=1 Tax=Haemaphysalis longicornis TaxID=44386 RepID=A0A9J6GBX0_HAELO|nr:hypothetical protein HPB48_017392 [Haemaphysalis longicornis]